MAALDVAALQRELNQLRAQRNEASTRYNALKAGNFPARSPGADQRQPGGHAVAGPYGGPGGPGPMRGAPGPYGQQRGVTGPGGMGRFPLDRGYGGPMDRDRGGERGFGGPARGGPQGVFSRLAGSGPAGPRGGGFVGNNRRPSDSEGYNAAPARKKLLSAVVVGDDEVPRSEQPPEHHHQELPSASGSGPSRKRAAEESVPAGSEAAKRARRLLGRSLLGTLQRFRAEDEQFQASDAASRRQELQRKAEEKSAAETERLRKAAAEERLAKRAEELSTLMALNLATDIKLLEVAAAKRIARRRALFRYLATREPAPAAPETAPDQAPDQAPSAGKISGRREARIFWLPAVHTPETEALAVQQADELAAWEASVLAELEEEKRGLAQRAEERKTAFMERQAQRAAEAEARAAQRAAAAEGAEEGAVDEGVHDAEEAKAAAAADEEDAELEAGELDGDDALISPGSGRKATQAQKQGSGEEDGEVPAGDDGDDVVDRDDDLVLDTGDAATVEDLLS